MKLYVLERISYYNDHFDQTYGETIDIIGVFTSKKLARKAKRQIGSHFESNFEHNPGYEEGYYCRISKYTANVSMV